MARQKIKRTNSLFDQIRRRLKASLTAALRHASVAERPSALPPESVEQRMPAYRIYVLTTDGHIAGPPQVLECENEQEAIGKAPQLANGKAVELWDGARLIARFPGNEDWPHPPSNFAETATSDSSKFLEGALRFGGSVMAKTTTSLLRYRVYFLDPNGHSTGTQFVETIDDQDGVKKARQLLDREDIELWDGERLVGRFEHDRPWPKDQ
jgi:hypothetical protein